MSRRYRHTREPATPLIDIHLRIDANLYREVSQLANKRECSITYILSEALKRWIVADPVAKEIRADFLNMLVNNGEDESPAGAQSSELRSQDSAAPANAPDNEPPASSELALRSATDAEFDALMAPVAGATATIASVAMPAPRPEPAPPPSAEKQRAAFIKKLADEESLVRTQLANYVDKCMPISWRGTVRELRWRADLSDISSDLYFRGIESLASEDAQVLEDLNKELAYSELHYTFAVPRPSNDMSPDFLKQRLPLPKWYFIYARLHPQDIPESAWPEINEQSGKPDAQIIKRVLAGGSLFPLPKPLPGEALRDRIADLVSEHDV